MSLDMDLKIGTAFVTGGARGIGRAICEALLNKGCKVCFADVNVENGEKTQRELQKVYGKTNCYFIKCDVSSEEEFEASYLKAKALFGNINILVNNAGVIYSRIVEINLQGVINGCNIAYKHMGKHNGGNGGIVVSVASIAALYPFQFTPIYSATKAGVIGLIRSFGQELHFQKTGIKFTALCPSGVDTELLQFSSEETRKIVFFPEQYNEMMKTMLLLKPHKVAEAIIQLIEDGINGAVMTVIAEKENKYVSFPSMEEFITSK